MCKENALNHGKGFVMLGVFLACASKALRAILCCCPTARQNWLQTGILKNRMEKPGLIPG